MQPQYSGPQYPIDRFSGGCGCLFLVLCGALWIADYYNFDTDIVFGLFLGGGLLLYAFDVRRYNLDNEGYFLWCSSFLIILLFSTNFTNHFIITFLLVLVFGGILCWCVTTINKHIKQYQEDIKNGCSQQNQSIYAKRQGSLFFANGPHERGCYGCLTVFVFFLCVCPTLARSTFVLSHGGPTFMKTLMATFSLTACGHWFWQWRRMSPPSPGEFNFTFRDLFFAGLLAIVLLECIVILNVFCDPLATITFMAAAIAGMFWYNVKPSTVPKTVTAVVGIFLTFFFIGAWPVIFHFVKNFEELEYAPFAMNTVLSFVLAMQIAEFRRRREEWQKMKQQKIHEEQRRRTDERERQKEKQRQEAEQKHREERRRQWEEHRRQEEQWQEDHSYSYSTPSEEKRYHEILGTKPGMSFDEIKKAYRQKVMQYHPDKVSQLGEKLREVAEQEMKKINEAYSYFERKHK